MSVRILLADDHRILREGLAALLEKQPDFAVVGQADNGRAAVRLARELSPDVVIMDISMPDLNGIEATRQILAEVAGAKVIALSMHSDRHFVRGMLKAGASGYLLKHSASQELIKAIQLVLSGRVYLSPDIAGIVVEEYKKPEQDASIFAILTPRELEVLQLLAEGKSPREISDALLLGVKTIEAYRRQIADKLGFKNFAELVKYAIREGLVSLE
jgi:two-component system, NarL family, response regulator NreC